MPIDVETPTIRRFPVLEKLVADIGAEAKMYEWNTNSASAADEPKIIIGLTGFKQSGKDTVARLLCPEDIVGPYNGFHHINFADTLRAMLKPLLEAYGFSQRDIRDIMLGSRKEEPLDCFGGRSYRFMAQTLGTEWGRDLVFDGIWINAFRRKAAQRLRVVCSDVRFPNEAEAIHLDGGKVYRVMANWHRNNDADLHPSEALIPTLEIDGEIENNFHNDDNFRDSRLFEAISALILRDFGVNLQRPFNMR